MSKVSVRQAALLTGKSRETINAATKDGIISFDHNEKGHKVIDLSELQRVYPIKHTMEEIKQSGTVKSSQNRTVNSQSGLEKELAVLSERLENLTKEKETLLSERRRERSQLESEIEHLRSSLESSQQQQKQTMLLLTDQRKDDEKRGQIENDQDRKLEALNEKVKEMRLQNKRIFQRYKNQQKEVELLKQQQQKNTTIWKKLFG